MTSAPARAFEQLCQNRLFEGIGAKVLERIRPDVNILQLKRGDVVFKEGDLGDSLYLVGEALAWLEPDFGIFEKSTQ